jgi:hypothetical protein
MNSPLVLEIMPNFPINRNSSLATTDQLHNPVNIPTFTPFPKKDLPKELPTDFG